MRSLISALAAAGLLMFTLCGYSADPAAPGGSPVMSKPDPNRPGRKAEEEQAVKAGGPSDEPGRKAEEEQAVKARGPSDEPGRKAEEEQAGNAGGPSEEPGPTGEKK